MVEIRVVVAVLAALAYPGRSSDSSQSALASDLAQEYSLGGNRDSSAPLTAPNKSATGGRGWEGAFNSSAGSELPANEGNLIPSKSCKSKKCRNARACGCKTAVKVTLADTEGWGKGRVQDKMSGPYCTCTSCHDENYAFFLQYHTSKAGQCKHFNNIKRQGGRIGCATLDGDYWNGGPDGANAFSNNSICTKAGLVTSLVRVTGLPDLDAQSWFADVKGSGGFMTPVCAMRKETVCRGRVCDVKKQVRCYKVCKFQWKNQDWKKLQGCSSRYCKDPKFAAMACLNVAKMA